MNHRLHTTSKLVLRSDLRAQLATWARAGYPRESCGLLIGRRTGETTLVEHVRRARNLAPGRERYDLDPAEHVRIDEEARALGAEVVGVWHSHPDRAAQPSAADRAHAWEAWSYLILSVTAAGVVELRSWRWSGARFNEEELATWAAEPTARLPAPRFLTIIRGLFLRLGRWSARTRRAAGRALSCAPEARARQCSQAP